MAWRLTGLSFECADDAAINAAHERLNSWLRNLASPDVALWTSHRAPPRTLATDRRRTARVRAPLAATDTAIASSARPCGSTSCTCPSSTGRSARRWPRRRYRCWPRRDAGCRSERPCGEPGGGCEARRRRSRLRCTATSRSRSGATSTAAAAARPCLSSSRQLINGEWRRIPLPRAPLDGRAGDDAPPVRMGDHRVPDADADALRRLPGHQGVSDADHARACSTGC